MQIPSMDPTGYCRLCFTEHQLRWLLQTSENPMVAQIQTCLGVALTPEVDFPCTVCRLCSAALESFEALRERAKLCDEVLRNSRVVRSAIASDVVECKQECTSPPPEICYPEPQQDVSSFVIREEPFDDADFLNTSSTVVEGGNNTIMVGDIKVELLNVRSEGNSNSILTQTKEKPDKVRRTFTCRVCKQTFVNETNLQKHIHSKHSSKHYADAMAAAVAAKRLRHPQNQPGEFKPISPKDIRKQMNMYSGSPNSTQYNCNMCNAKFSQWQPFLRHQRSHAAVDGTGQAGSNLENVPSS